MVLQREQVYANCSRCLVRIVHIVRLKRLIA